MKALAGFDKGFVDFEEVGQEVFGCDGRLAPRVISLLSRKAGGAELHHSWESVGKARGYLRKAWRGNYGGGWDGKERLP